MAAPWAQGIPFVDPNVEYVGVTRLRAFNATNLRQIKKMLVIQDNDKPLAVMMSYAQYLSIQSKLQEAMDALEVLSKKELEARLLAGIKDAAEGRVKGAR